MSHSGKDAEPGFHGSPKDKCTCLFCGKQFAAQVSRIRAHIAQLKGQDVFLCPGVEKLPDENEQRFLERKHRFESAKARCLSAAAEKEATRKKQKTEAMLNVATGGVLGRAAFRAMQPKITGFATNTKQKEANEAFARGMYAAGISPNVLRNRFVMEGLRKVALVGPSYVPPTAEAVEDELLVAEKKRVSEQVAARRETVSKVTGTTIVSDGATTVDKRPIINILEVCAGCVEFRVALDCSGKVKDKEYIAQLIIDDIVSRPDPKSVVQVLMDNATRGSWPLIEAACPWVTVGPCAPHCLDLELEDIGKLARVKAVTEKTAILRRFVRKHHHVLAAFREVATSMLIQPGATRFATVLIGFDNVMKNREALCLTFESTAVKDAVQRNPHQRSSAADGTPGKTLEQQYREARDIVSDYWSELKVWSEVMKPIAKLLRLTDSDAPTASKVPYHMFEVQEQLKQVDVGDADLTQEIIAIHRNRWDYMFTIVQYAGYLLDPEFWDMDQESDDETMDAFFKFVDKVYCYPPKPAQDASAAQKEEYDAAVKQANEMRAQAERELQVYRGKQGIFARASVQENARKISAAQFWMTYGSRTPALMKVAVRCTGQVAGAGASERGHKEMNFVLSKNRNRLGFSKVRDYMIELAMA